MNKNLTPEDLARLDQLEIYLKEKTNQCFGYPCTLDFDYSPLQKFLKYSINNIGDSFYQGGSFHLSTHAFEREVVDFFAQLLNAPINNYWGYITNGSTEGNLYGLYLVKRIHPSGIVYFSEESHYSIEKNISLLDLKYEKIKTQENGEIDYDDFEINLSLTGIFRQLLLPILGLQ